MPTACRVCGSYNDRNRTYHKFPKDKDRRDEWIKILGLDPGLLERLKELRICGEHFDTWAFVDVNATKKRLVWNAVPRKHGAVRPAEQVELEEPSANNEPPVNEVSLSSLERCQTWTTAFILDHTYPVPSVPKKKGFRNIRLEVCPASTTEGCVDPLGLAEPKTNVDVSENLQRKLEAPLTHPTIAVKGPTPNSPAIKCIPLGILKPVNTSASTATPLLIARPTSSDSTYPLFAIPPEVSWTEEVPLPQPSISTRGTGPLGDITNVRGKWTCTCCCKRTFDSRRELRDHIVELADSLACPSCEEPFSSPRLLAVHLSKKRCRDLEKTQHETTRTLPVDDETLVNKESISVSEKGEMSTTADGTDCDHSYTVPTELKQHRKKAPKLQCPSCDEKFSTMGKLQIHVKAMHKAKPSRDESLVCEFCGSIYLNTKAKKRHVRRYHTENMFECLTCGAKVRDKNIFEQHMRGHTGEKPHQCSYCPKKFISHQNLMRHVRFHTKESPYICSYCGKQTADSFALKQHEATHRKEILYSCTKCGKGFSSWYVFHNHKKRPVCASNTSRRNAMFRDRGQIYVCSVCNRICTGFMEFSRHSQEHGSKDGRYPCDLCGKSSFSAGSLYVHRQRNHSTETATCQYCSQIFQNRLKCDEHVAKVHQKKYACSLCNRRFANKAHLRLHFRNHDDGTLVLTCGECGAAFAAKHALEDHVGEHADPHKLMGDPIVVHPEYAAEYNKDTYQPRSCDMCGKKCKSSIHLYDHVRSVHEKPFKCPCGAEFVRRKQFAQHEATCSVSLPPLEEQFEEFVLP